MKRYIYQEGRSVPYSLRHVTSHKDSKTPLLGFMCVRASYVYLDA